MTDHIQSHTESILGERHTVLFATLVILSVIPALLMLLGNYTLPMLVYLSIPFVLFLISAPKYSFYFLMAINFVYAPYYMTGFAVHPWDIAGILFLASVGISWLFNYSARLDKTPFDFSLWALIFATFISGLFAIQPSLSIIPIVRIILIYLTFRAFYYLSSRYKISSMILFFVFAHTAFSIYNSALFISYGGSLRIFGVSGIAFETFSMIGIPATLALAIWSTSGRMRLLYSIFFLINLFAAIATMSRGPLLTVSIACPVLIALSWLKAKKIKARYARSYLKTIIGILIPILVLLIFGTGFFLQVGERFEELSEGVGKGTVMLRYSLWKAAWESFLLDPITGIGVGNFRVIDELLPHLKFDPVRYYLVGTSFHNVFLQYLAETGIPGAGALLVLGWIILSTGRRIYKYSEAHHEMPTVMIAFISAFTVFITIFYMRVWTWGQEGYILAFILAILARQYKIVKENKSELS